MSPIIYEPEDNLRYMKIQKELKEYYGENLIEGSIIHHKGVYYKFVIDYTYWAEPTFIEMNAVSVWWARKRGKID